MSATTPRKRRAGKLVEGRRMAQQFFKNGKFTSEWTEHDAKTYFGMNKAAQSVLRSGPKDTASVEWYLDVDGSVKKREVV